MRRRPVHCTTSVPPSEEEEEEEEEGSRGGGPRYIVRPSKQTERRKPLIEYCEKWEEVEQTSNENLVRFRDEKTTG